MTYRVGYLHTHGQTNIQLINYKLKKTIILIYCEIIVLPTASLALPREILENILVR